MSNKVFQKLHIKQMGRLLRRFAALTVAGSMLLSTAAMAADPLPSYMEDPIKMRDGEAPTITIESNAVVDRWYDPDGPESAADYLTGELEVVIRAKSGCIIDEDGSEDWQGFNTLGVALKYSSLLEPYQWTDGENAIDLTGTDAFEDMVNQQTLKDKNITTAMAQVSGVNGEGGYLYFEVEAQRPIVLQEDTVLAVVTFKYDLDTVGPILAEDAAQWLTPVQSGGDAGGSGDAGDVTTRVATDCLIQFATIDEIMDRFQPCELVYNSAYGEDFRRFNTMYYSEKSVDGMEAVDPSTGDRGDYNRLDLSVDYNNVEEHKVNFSLVNKPTYNDGGLSLDDLATVLFYDWDDTLLGVLIVPRNGDARQVVNTYVHDNLIHPDLRDNTNYSSLARTDNYRGKYPSSGPAADGTTDGSEVTDGDKYLTGKLDYAFFKRPMVQDEADPNVWTQTTNADDDTQAAWDDKYPYIHGWAIVDYSHPENTWTTIGVGELSTYTGSASGGYRDLNGAPAQLTVSGQDFTFANFDFRKTNSLEPGSIYAVKAVYEPGESLLTSGYQYRMISVPYYNKMNNPSASNGGAYSVDLVYERASDMSTGNIQGVARARELVVRMETTSDIRWEGEDFDNATNSEQSSKTKTTYSNVPVDNVDAVNIQLVLSGRHNKLNYYLMDAYGASFVTGAERSAANTTLINTVAHALDNYNYKNDDSNLTDDFYDAPYIDRDGSRGFVLYGTLNNLAQKVTEYISGELSISDFYSYISMDNFNDINLRTTGGAFITAATEEMVQDAFVAIVREAIAAHDSGNNTWWDVEHDCAQFTYHQLQLYVMQYTAGSTPTLLSAEAADAQVVPWCHLHENCAAQSSGKPTNFASLIQTALDGEADKIQLLLMTEAENMAHFRADADGAPFASMTAYANALVTAVQAIGNANATWEQVQDQIIRGQADTEYARAHYWWYDGTESIRLSGLGDVIAAAQDAMIPVAAPGSTTAVLRTAKINQLEEAFNNNAAQPGDITDAAWVRATENLCLADGVKFADFDTFRTTLLNALTVLGNDVQWGDLQYYIIHGVEADHSDPAVEQEIAAYWWHNGGRKVTDASSMLMAAQAKNAAWEAFTYDDLYNYSGLNFRKNFKGEMFTSGEFATFKSAMENLADNQGTNLSWAQVQYFLIHGNTGNALSVSGELTYYWWVNGGEGTSVDFSVITDYDSGLGVFLEAAFRYEINGNVHAWDDLTADIIKTTRLIKNDNGNTTFDTLDHFSDKNDFVAGMNGFATAAGGLPPEPGQNLAQPIATWQQTQYYLLNGTFVDDSTASVENYWWRLLDDLGSAKTPQERFDEFLAAIQEIFDSGDPTAADEWVSDVENMNAVFINPNDPEGGFTQDDAAGFVGAGIWEDFVNSGAFGSAAEISWYQLEYGLLNWCYMWLSDSDIMDDLVNNYGFTIPDWVPAPATFFSVHPMMAARRPVTTVETDEDTGVTTVTTVTKTEVGENILIVTTVTTIDPITGEATTVTTTQLTDEEGNILSESTTVTTTPAEAPEEPGETTEPTEPEPPTDSVEPEIPAVPGETTDPTESETPVEPVEPTEPETPTEPVEPEEPDFVDPPEESERPEEKPPMTEGTDPETLEPSKELPKEDSTEPEGPEDVQPSEETAEGGADMMGNENLITFNVMTTAYRQQLTTKFNSLNRLRLRTLLEPLKLSGMNISRWSGPGTLGPPTLNVSRLSLDLSHIFAAGRITT